MLPLVAIEEVRRRISASMGYNPAFGTADKSQIVCASVFASYKNSLVGFVMHEDETREFV